MIKKLSLIVILSMIFLVSSVSAFSIPEGDVSLNTTPNSFTSTSYTIDNIKANETVRVSASNIPSDFGIGFSKTYFDHSNTGKQASVFVMAGDVDVGNYWLNVVFDNETNQVKRNVSVAVGTGLNEIWTGYLKKGEVLKLDDYTNFVVDEVGSTDIHFNVTDFGEAYASKGNSTTLSSGQTKLKVEVLNIIKSLNTVQLKLSSNHDYNPYKGGKEAKGCLLDVRTIVTMRRGNMFYGETINVKTGEVVSLTTVTLLDGGAKGEDQLVGRTQSDNTGFFSIRIPEDAKGPMVMRLNNKKCQDNNLQKAFETPYNTYKEQQKKYSLVLKNVNEKVILGKKISGQVFNKKDKKTKAKIEITDPEGTKSTVETDKNGKFSFKGQKVGTYEVFAKRLNYDSSDKHEINVLRDSDADGIDDVKDKCPDKKGIKELDGCPRLNTYMKFYMDGKTVESVPPGSENVEVRLFSEENGELISSNPTGKVSFQGQERTLKFDNGIADVPKLPEGLKGRMTANVTSFGKYSGSSANIQIKGGFMGMFSNLFNWNIIWILIIIVAIVLLIRYRGIFSRGKPKEGLKYKSKRETPKKIARESYRLEEK